MNVDGRKWMDGWSMLFVLSVQPASSRVESSSESEEVDSEVDGQRLRVPVSVV